MFKEVKSPDEKLINIEDIIMSQYLMIVEIPEEKSTLKIIRAKLDADAIYKIAKMGSGVKQFLDVDVADGLILNEGDYIPFRFKDKGVIKQYVLVEAHNITFAVKNQGNLDELKLDRRKIEPNLNDPNIISPALDAQREYVAD